MLPTVTIMANACGCSENKIFEPTSAPRSEDRPMASRILDCTSTRVNLYGRAQELARLKSIVNRMKSQGRREIVLVEGPSGVGKTSLVRQALKKEKACLVASGIFGPRSTSPLDSISNAIANLIWEIESDADLAVTLKDRILNEFSHDDILTLTRVAPGIKSLLNLTTSGKIDAQASHRTDRNDCNCLVRNVKSVFRSFLRIITAEYPLVLCLFELQYADAPTLELVEFISNDEEQTHLIIIATCHDHFGLPEDHPIAIWRRKADVGFNTPAQISLVTLSGLDLNSVTDLVANELNLEREQALPLASIVSTRTDGNPFFVMQLLDHWQDQGLLSYDESGLHSRWTWDTNKIQATALAENVVDLVSSRLHCHPSNVQRVLQVAACLGFKFKTENLLLLDGAFPDEAPLRVAEAIDTCVEERLLEHTSDGHLMFFHEDIFQATLSRLPQGEELGKLHLRIGLILFEHLLSFRAPDDRLIFLCLDRISNGHTHLEDRITKLELAKLYHKAGTMAIELSAFASAAAYSKSGIDFLENLGMKWVENHELCTGLFVNLSQTQYVLGQFDASLKTIEELLSNDPDTSSRLRANLTRIRIFKASSNLKEVLSASLAFLNEIGLSLPNKPTYAQAQFKLHKTKTKLDRIPNADLLGASPITNPSIATAVKVLNLMMIPLETLKKQNLAIMVACRAVKLCIVHGICEDSAEAFVIFGIFCIAERGWLAEGHRLGELGLEMSQTQNSALNNANVASFVYLMTKPWQLTPMSQCVSPMFDCHVEAMKREDPFVAFMIINHYFAIYFYSSLELGPLLSDIERFSAQMLEYGQKLIFLQILPIWQCVLNLTGNSSNVLDVENGEARDRQHDVGNENGLGQQACWSYAMQLAVYMGNLDVASEMADRLKCLHIGITKAHVFYPARVFFFGLIAIQKARATGKLKYRQEAAKYIAVVRSWIKKKAANHVHKLLILEAEYASLFCKQLSLQKKYDTAISAARKSGYAQDAAIAAQLAASALNNIDQLRVYSDSYLLRAHELWLSWGAHAIASKMAEDHPQLNLTLRSRSGSVYLSKERYDPTISESHMRRLS